MLRVSGKPSMRMQVKVDRTAGGMGGSYVGVGAKVCMRIKPRVGLGLRLPDAIARHVLTRGIVSAPETCYVRNQADVVNLIRALKVRRVTFVYADEHSVCEPDVQHLHLENFDLRHKLFEEVEVRASAIIDEGLTPTQAGIMVMGASPERILGQMEIVHALLH